MSTTATRSPAISRTLALPGGSYIDATDGELVDACRAGDQLAWNALIRRHSPRLWAIARFNGLDTAAAEDVVQTAWSTLCRSLDRLDNDSAVSGWLSTVVKREAIRASKAQRRTHPSELLASELPLPDERLGERERVEALRRALAQLPAQSQALLGLLFSDAELSYEEIAKRIGRSVGSIGPTRARCLARLRAILERDPAYRSLSDVP
jgi:RNA polymerase sigma factor (sigma-70 family)